MKSYYKLWVPEIFSIAVLMISISMRLNIYEYDYKFIFSNCICFVSIICGSLITVASISASGLGEKYLKPLKIFESESNFSYYIGSPIISGITLSILSMIFAIMMDLSIDVEASKAAASGMVNVNVYRIYITAFWLMLSVYFIYSSIRSFYINVEIMKALHKSRMTTEKSGGDEMVKIIDMVSEEE